MGIPGTLAAFAVALCVCTQADAVEEAGRVAIAAPWDLSREVRPAPRPPIIVNAVPPRMHSKNMASSPAQPAEHPACTAKASQDKAASCSDRQNVGELRPET
jgi:hypothetical protein